MRNKDIIRAVNSYYEVDLEEITHHRVNNRLGRAMQVAMFMIQKENRLSHIELGDMFKRDHSSITTYLQKIRRNIDDYQEEIEAIYRLAKKLNIWGSIEGMEATWEQKYYALKGAVMSGLIKEDL